MGKTWKARLLQIIICDMDNTLCFPSPYCEESYLRLSLKEQHIKAQTGSFAMQCLETPLAKWVSEYRNQFFDFHLFPSTYFKLLLTARWFYLKTITERWLQHHNLFFDYIHFLNFNDFKTLQKEKVIYIQRVIQNFPCEFLHSPVMNYLIFDDNKAIIKELAKTRYRTGAIPHFYLIQEGELMEWTK